MIKCNRCKVVKDKCYFNNNTKCTDCVLYCREYYLNNKEREIARAKKSLYKDRDKTNKYKKELRKRNPLSIMLQGARNRSKKYGLPFNLTLEDLQSEYQDVCPVLGINICVNTGHVKENSITLDRIVPELGYVKGNIAIISHKANTIKNNATVAELERVLQWLKAKQK